jgi:hypothetical protein
MGGQKALAEWSELSMVSPVVEVHSKFAGFGVLSRVDGDIYVLTNSHILRGSGSAVIRIPKVSAFDSFSPNPQPMIEFTANVKEGSDDPIGDVVLLKVPRIGDDTDFREIQNTARWLEFCEIRFWNCSEGFRTKADWFGFNRSHGILIPEKIYKNRDDRYQKLSLIPSFNKLPIEEKESDSIIASENAELLVLPTYGRPGFSGLPLVADGEIKGVLTVTHFDGTPLVYGIGLRDIAKRLQKSLFRNDEFKYQIVGQWDGVNGDLIANVKSWTIRERNSNAPAGASGGEGGTSGGGEGGTSGDFSQNQLSQSHQNDSLLEIELSPIIFGLSSLAASGHHSLAIKNPVIARQYQPLTISRVKSSPLMVPNPDSHGQRSMTEMTVPFLISPLGVPQLASTALLSGLLLRNKVCNSSLLEFQLNCDEANGIGKDTGNYFIPDLAAADIYLKERRLLWSKRPRFIRYYEKKSSELISNRSLKIGNAQVFDNTLAISLGDSDSILHSEEEKIVRDYKSSDRFKLARQLEELRYSPDRWGFTPIFPFAVKNTNDSIIEFRFEDRDTQTFIEFQLSKTGDKIVVSEFDLPAFRSHESPRETLTLGRISSDRNPSWWFEATDQKRSDYRAFYSFNRDNLGELERVFIESKNFIFEIISCPIGERECVR